MTILRDARFGLRLLGRNPGFTAVAVITLALGISATTAIFSVVYGTFFAPLPYRDADALVMLWSQFRDDRVPVATRDFVEWKRQATSFSDLNAWGLADVGVATTGGPDSLQAGVATPGFLAMLGYGHPLALGRTFREEESTPRSRGHPHAPALAGRFRRESRHHRTADSYARRRCLYRHRRARRWSGGPSAGQTVAAADGHTRRARRRRPVSQRDGPAETWRHGRRGQRQSRRGGARHRARPRAGPRRLEQRASSHSATTSSATARSRGCGCCWAPWLSCC